MSELHDLLERRAAGYVPPADLLQRVHERGRQRERNRRAGTALVALLVIAVSIGGLFRARPPADTVVFDQPPDPLVGTWVSIDADGSSQTMDVRVLDGGGYAVVVDDDAATVCSGVASTMTGTGQLDGVALVIATPVLTCDDGSTPVLVDGSSLEEALRDYTLVHDAETDTLEDSFGVRWGRQGADPPEPGDPPGPTTSALLWPQSGLEAVRAAQEQADAGDPDHTWQLAPEIVIDTAPGDAEIFRRYLTQELGWDSFRWQDGTGPLSASGCSEGCASYGVAFVRCATDQTNPLYPDDPEGGSCAPTINEVTYETVTVEVTQPVRTGTSGIWVVTGADPSEPVLQRVPRSDAEVAAVLEDFLQARVDGEGADEHVDPSAAEIPLLYAASSGARYEEFDYQVRGPRWVTGSFDVTTRLYADGRATVVEQQFGLDDAEEDRLLLNFEQGSTTEDGEPVAEPYSILDDEVTFRVAPPWYGFFDYGPDTIALDSGDQAEADLAVLADPLPVESGCEQGPAPADAEALAMSIRSDPDLEATEPVAASVGGIEALQMDVVAAAGATVCIDAGTPLVVSGPQLRGPVLQRGDRMRLYLLDLPAGSPARVLAIAFVAPQTGFDFVIEEAPPILDSFSFDTP